MTTQMNRTFFNNKLLLIFGVITFCFAISTDAQLTDSFRLPKNIIPKNYTLNITPNLEKKTYEGQVIISLLCLESTKNISLNSKDLDIKTVTVNTSNTNISVVSTDLTTATNILQIYLQDEIPANTICDLSITFDGKMNGTDGFYVSTLSNGEQFLASALKPSSARKAFPCFDEPEYKASFKISIRKPKNYLALSNMKIESNTTDSDSNTEVVTFSNTLYISPFVLSLVLCTFGSKKTEITTNGGGKKLDLTIYAQKNQIQNAKFALDITAKAIERCEEYFEMSYPLSHLELIAIPGYKENLWGLMTVKESLLILDTATASSNNKKTIALALTHVLAAVYVGDIVTTDWWSNQWLYEGFSLLMSYNILNAMEPTWTMLDQFPTRVMHSALDIDATPFSHPLEQPIESLDKIATTLDSFTSGKGACILRMVEDFIGKDKFRSVIRSFLKKNAYGNAGTKEFLSSLEENLNNSSVNATRMLSSWINQPGYPLVTVKAINNNSYELTQSRFFKTSNTSEQTYSSWYIPLTYTTNKGVKNITVWFPDNEEKITLTLDKDEEWCKLNNEQRGYYRSNYSDEILEKLLAAMKDNSTQLTNTDKANIVNDCFAIAKSEAELYEQAMNTTTVVTNDFVVLKTVYAEYIDLANKLRNTTALDNLKKYFRSLIKPVYESISWDKTNSTVMEGSLRALVLNQASECGLPAAEELVSSLFKAYLNSTENEVDPTIRYYVYCYGMNKANQEEWDKLYQRYLNETDSQEKSKLKSALTTPTNITVLQRCLELTMSEKNITDQEFLSILTFLSANPVGNYLVWDYIRANWTQLVKRYTLGGENLDNLIFSIASHFKTVTRLDEMNNFFSQYPEVGVGAISRAQKIIVDNIGWKGYNVVSNWLDAKVKSENL